MNHGKETIDNKIFFLALLFISILPALFCLPLMADAGWISDFQNGSAMTAYEKARAGRSEAVENAKIAFEKAKAAGGEHAAPYHFYAAEEYLKLAKEELAAGDKIGVALFAAKSEEFSFLAMEKAEGDRK